MTVSVIFNRLLHRSIPKRYRNINKHDYAKYIQRHNNFAKCYLSQEKLGFLLENNLLYFLDKIISSKDENTKQMSLWIYHKCLEHCLLHNCKPRGTSRRNIYIKIFTQVIETLFPALTRERFHIYIFIFVSICIYRQINCSVS